MLVRVAQRRRQSDQKHQRQQHEDDGSEIDLAFHHSIVLAHTLGFIETFMGLVCRGLIDMFLLEVRALYSILTLLGQIGH